MHHDACTHVHMYGCWVIRTICVIIKGTIQLVQLLVANDHPCKCRYLNWLMFFKSSKSHCLFQASEVVLGRSHRGGFYHKALSKKCVIIKGTIQLVQLIVAHDHSCKCRCLNLLMLSNSKS
jgi:hypothetical protein